MKIARNAFRAAALAVLFSGATASAQQVAPATDLSYPAAQTAYDKYYQPTPASPSDREYDDRADEKTEEATVGAAPVYNGGAAAPAADGPVDCYSETYEPVRLFGRTPFEKKWGIQSIGWIASSYTQNFDSPTDRFNGPVTWTDRSNDWQLNELYSIVKRDPMNDGEGWDWGFRVDTQYGTSSRFNTSAGFEDKFQSNIDHSFYNIAMPNATVVAQYNDLKISFGRYLSPVGFYAIGTYNNFFNTLPYTFQYGEPFTHTGFLAQYQATDDLNLGAGLTRGWDNTGSFNPGAGYIGTVVRNNLAKEGDSISWVPVFSSAEPVTYSDNGLPIIAGPAGSLSNPAGVPNNPPAFRPRYLQTLVYSRPIGEKLTYIIQSDFGIQANAWQDGSAAHWYGVNQYLYYKVNNCWSWGINGEWFRDDTGYRVGGFLPNYYQAYYGSRIRGLPTNRSNYRGNFYQVTVGPRWTPNPNLVIRPNLRFDFFDGVAGTGFLPYADGTKSNQGILGTDVVLVY
jgi:hypothetical protein